MKTNSSLFKTVFDFLASLKVAVTLLVGLSLLLAWATVFESKNSTEAVQEVVYTARWFDALLLLLGVNILFATIKRWPWRKRHIGLVTTHIGILILLVGALLTRQYGLEGQVILQENETADHLLMNKRVFGLSIPRTGEEKEFKPWFVNQPIPEGKSIRYEIGNVECFVEGFYENPVIDEVVNSGGTQKNPAVSIQVVPQGQSASPMQQWMFANDSERNHLAMRAADIYFKTARTESELEELLAPSEQLNADDIEPVGQLNIQTHSGETIGQVALADLTEEAFTITHAGKQATLRFSRLLKRTALDEDQLVDHADTPINPSVHLQIESEGEVEEHYAFAFFPTVGSYERGQHSPSGLQVSYAAPYSKEDFASNEMTLVAGPDESLHFAAVSSNGGYERGTLESNQRIDCGWPNVDVLLTNYFPRAAVETHVREGGPNAHSSHRPSLDLRLRNGDQEIQQFIPYGSQRPVQVGGEMVMVHFGRKQVPLGFSLKLIDFRAPTYPGTNRPALYESDVMLTDTEAAYTDTVKIHMNHPLSYGRYTVYQSGYQPGSNGRPDISIFSVAYAPGTPIIYVGSIIMIAGMILIFIQGKPAGMNAPKNE